MYIKSLVPVALIMLGACGQPVETVRPVLSFEQAASSSQSKKPTAPFDQVEINKQIKQIADAKAPGLAERLLGHPNTLYWKERDTWGFYQGDALAAEMDKQKRIVVKDMSDEDSVKLCVFDEAGQLARASNTDAGQCKELMFSLDQALGE